MHDLSSPQRSELETMFGPRVSFQPVERRLYGHDVGAMPRRIRPLVGDTTPDGVVQPESEAELVALVRWALRHGVPLTPRAKATSGYGGVVPIDHGLVVDMRRLHETVAVNREALTVTVGPAAVWERLDRELEKEGLTLRLYPSSYPSSTVGGWLAQGGAGYGSFRYGWFRDNVVSARVVLPTGKVRLLESDEIDLISGAEGITGFITQVTFRVMPREEIDVVAAQCSDPKALGALIEGVVAARIPVWSVSFHDPKMIELTNRCPPRAHPHEEHLELPVSWLAVFAVPKSADAEPALDALIARAGATRLGSELATHAWNHRFQIMRVKRLGPSLVPAEVVVPLDALSSTLEELGAAIDQPLVMEGIAIEEGLRGVPEVVILGFIPQDERTLAYDIVFGLALTVLAVAERHGGRAYSTGLYFGHKAEHVLGSDALSRLARFKKEVDPNGVMNPGKVLGTGAVANAIRAAQTVEPLVRFAANRITTNPREEHGGDVRGIPGDVVEYAYACAQCGYCVDECDQFYGRGWESQSPRGKWYFLREYVEGKEEMSQFMIDSFLSCTTCELCDTRCPLALPIEPSWMKLRGRFVQDQGKMTFPPFEIMTAALRSQGDIWAGYRRDRANWFPGDLAEKHGPEHKSKNVYFAGCTASYVEQDIGIASVRLLDEAGVDFTYLGEKESCCATPMLVAGKWDVFVETMKKNIAAVKEAGADTVISSCPACDMMWRKVYPEWAAKAGVEYGITAKHYSEVVSEKLETGELVFPDDGKHHLGVVTWHDSCHIGRASGVFEPPRDLLRAMPDVELREMEHNREQAHCCGSVLTLLKEPEVAADIGKARLDEATAVGAKTIVALCPCCEFQLRVSAEARDADVEVVDLAHLAAERLGYELPDPHPEVRAQWAVFEKMIALLTPAGFASLLMTMWPELLAAMPLGLGGVMRFFGKIPGALWLMRPFFPVLFPILLPRMMPKLLPAMLDRIRARIPMPDYMAEQLPGMMPGVMDALMPHMLKDVVPLVSDPLIEYLESPTRPPSAVHP